MTPPKSPSGGNAKREAAAYLLPFPMKSFSRPIAVPADRATIGRSPQNTIVIDTATVSRRHAVMVYREGRHYIKDLESSNGTFINHQRTTVSRVMHHDRVTFGDQTFIFLQTGMAKKNRAGDHRPNGHSDAFVSRDVANPGEMLAYAAESARLTLFPDTVQDDAPPPAAAVQPDDHRFSLLDKLSGRQRPPAATPSPAEKTRPNTLLEQNHHRLSLLYRLSERLRTEKHPGKILDAGLELVLEAIPPAERSLIMLRSGNGTTLRMVACRHRTPKDDGDELPVSRTLIDWVLTEKMALMTRNVADDVRLKDSESIRVNPLNAIICVPIMVTGKVLGILYVDAADLIEETSQEDVAFTAAVAHELALTIVNISLQRSVIRNERMAAIGLTVSNLAHNIKNLAMLNQNALDLMRLHLDRLDDEKADKCWGIVENGLTRVNTLAMEMLAYARDQRLSPTSTDINRVILANRALFEESLGDKKVTLNFELTDANPQWMIDEKEFQRALLNLVVNAIDAVAKRSDGLIRIATAVTTTRQLVVAVRDNGSGIEADKQRRIFDLFFTTKGSNGSGLGLPMVSKFVTASGGRLLLKSKPGVGTLFKMVFPPTPMNPA